MRELKFKPAPGKLICQRVVNPEELGIHLQEKQHFLGQVMAACRSLQNNIAVGDFVVMNKECLITCEHQVNGQAPLHVGIDSVDLIVQNEAA